MRKLVLAALAVAPLLAGCGVDLPFLPKTKAQLLLGEWDCTAPDMPPGMSHVTMAFAKGDDLTISVKGDMNQGGMSMHMDADVDGSYKLTKDTLMLSPETAHLNSMTMNGQNFDLSIMGGKQAVEQQMAAGMEKGEFTIIRLDREKLVLEMNNQTTKCERS